MSVINKPTEQKFPSGSPALSYRVDEGGLQHLPIAFRHVYRPAFPAGFAVLLQVADNLQTPLARRA
jgi:hypothetical protein